MPLYEYKCDSCDAVFEVLQKFSDEPLKTHENCGGTVHRLISPPAFQFKGTGWYITDYARKNGSSAGSHHNGSNGTASSSTPAGETKTSGSSSKSAEASKS